MGLLDIPKETLNPDIWDLNTMTLKRFIKKELLNRVTKIVPLSYVSEMTIIGSSTSYKYNSSSDLDVGIRIPGKLITDKLQKTRKAVNEKLLEGTTHPINYFVSAEEYPSQWEDSYYGVYDVLNNKWLAQPPLKSKVLNPQKEFWFELILGNMELDYFRMVIHKWKQYEKSGNEELSRKYFLEAKDIAQKKDRDRKTGYEYGWGIPRKSWQNVVYKLMEHSDVGAEFEFLKEIKDSNADKI